ncbi:hypothetical protein MPER_11890 [Moniliophthora perniciosa FA553]|nr:hypothetical protein MPER_11890 [Moniliophthora perniciosa FA553]
MSFYSPIASAALRKVTSLGSLKQPQPVKSCDDVNCSGSWNAPRIGPSEPKKGDIFSIPMSVYTPFRTLVGVQPKDSESYYTAGGSKGARPCIIIDTPKRKPVYVVLLMASFDKSEEEDVPAPFKRFLIPIATSRRPIKGNAQHIHTTPEWENVPQYLVLIAVGMSPRICLGGRWSSRKVERAKQKFDFYVDAFALEKFKAPRFYRNGRPWEFNRARMKYSRTEYLEPLRYN